MEKFTMFLKKFISAFLAMFTTYTCMYTLIATLFLERFSFPFVYIRFIFFISIITSLILLFILKLNKLNFIMQTTLIYLVITLSIYFIGFYTLIFVNTKAFWLASILINVVGFIVILGIVWIKKIIENKKLNNSLNKFKGSDK